MRNLLIFALSFTLLGCGSTYYTMLETVGIEKRDVLADRVEAATQAQIDARDEFKTALEALQELTRYDEETLEKAYKKIEKQYKASESAANEVTVRIDAIEEVSNTLFDEWDNELDLYSNSGLRRESEKKIKETKLSYQQMLSAMAKAEKKMVPVLETLRDNMLYLKHNLNASALDALSIELDDLKIDVERAIRDMNTAINESSDFIDSLHQRETERSIRG